MRDNDVLDAFWGEEPAPAPPPPKFSRANGLLDKLMGVPTQDIFQEFKEIPKPCKRRNAKTTPKVTKTKTTRKRRKFTKVSPGEAIDALAAWEKKLLKARAMVQKYRQAVKRYQKQGRI
jgi:hypothetical protein